MALQADRDKVAQALTMLDPSNPVGVGGAIDTLLSIPAVPGDPAAATKLADAMRAAAGTTDDQSRRIAAATNQNLPEVWVGASASATGDVLVSAAEDLERGGAVLSRAFTVFGSLADGLTKARDNYLRAQDPLHTARSAADHVDYPTAISLAGSGGRMLLEALDGAINAGRDASSALAKLTTEARAHQLNTPGLTASDRLVLGEAAVPGGPFELNRLLTESDAERASQKLAALSPQDRQRFTDLLAQAKSPQERAYLMKALAAGHPVDEVAGFDSLIHAHGDDPTWLRDHLTPVVNQPATTAAGVPVDYLGANWGQGELPTCVPSSSIAARAMLDPTYALWLTTGNKPDDQGSSSGAAFAQRLRAEQTGQYDQNRNFVQNLFGADGLTDGQSEDLSNEDIGRYDGKHYETRGVSGPDERRAVLPDVERAVDRGDPVPVLVDGDGGRHQMVVVGHEGNRLEIYNPWGDVTWVNEDDFVNGHLDRVSGGRFAHGPPANVRGVNLPS